MFFFQDLGLKLDPILFLLVLDFFMSCTWLFLLWKVFDAFIYMIKMEELDEII